MQIDLDFCADGVQQTIFEPILHFAVDLSDIENIPNGHKNLTLRIISVIAMAKKTEMRTDNVEGVVHDL